jgi:RHS repeat-associated protein
MDQILAEINVGAATVAFTLTDRQGSVRDTADGTSGYVLDHVEYGPYGAVVSQTSAANGGNIGYDGYVTQQDVGLDRAGPREYNPSTGQWLQVDPTTTAAGPNFREYAGNDPTNATDPTGLLAADRDESGPDVTSWFAKEIVAQVAWRRDRYGINLGEGYTNDNPWWIVPAYTADIPRRIQIDGEAFRFQAAYLLSAKWMDFGGPDSGKGVHTVSIANRVVIRKNQLGNMEFAMIATLYTPGGLTSDDWAVEKAREIPGVQKYDSKHPYGKNMYGKWAEYERADNLAAFGVGWEIAQRIRKLDSFKKQGVPTEAEVKVILNELFKDDKALDAATKHYQKYSSHKGGLGLEDLTFIPNFGGFNTQNLTLSGAEYGAGNKTGIDYYIDVLQPGYAGYRRKHAASEYAKDYAPFDKDAWLQNYYENYDVYRQRQFK